MAQNPVAANLVMAAFLVGGVLVFPYLRQEVSPEFALDMIEVNVAYPGASPTDVEQGIILVVEEAVQGLDGIREVRSTATESAAAITIELNSDADPDRALSDIKAAVDRISSLPEDSERPVISLAFPRTEVAVLAIYGDANLAELRTLAENARDRLLAADAVSHADIAGIRPPEISVEVSQEDSRRYGLGLEQIAARIRSASVDMPGGGVRTVAGEVLLRTTERRYTGAEFGDIVLLSRPDGTQVHVRDVGTVVDGFAETDQESYYMGHRAAFVHVFGQDDSTPTETSDALTDFISEEEANLPEGVEFAVWADWSGHYQGRLDLLLRNARAGLVLVLLVLGLFLEVRLAFWVTLGIPISFVGALPFLPITDVSINAISLFAFIVTLGMVVDDAIIVGEAIYKHREDGLSPLDAAIAGVREVASPVVFSIATSCIAFAPMLFLPGWMGNYFYVVPAIVIPILLVSLVESMFVLPAHLALSKPRKHGLLAFITRYQRRFMGLYERFIEFTYPPVLRWTIRNRYLAAASGIAMLIVTVGLVAGERVGYVFMQSSESYVISASLTMPFGTPIAETRRATDQLEASLAEALGALGGAGPEVVRGQMAMVGDGASHLSYVSVYLVPPDERSFTGRELSDAWRDANPDIPGAESLTYHFSAGPGGGSAISIELSHPDTPTLESAAAYLAARLGTYGGVIEIDDGVAAGKEQISLRLKPAARSVGLSEINVARQVRAAFFGVEAVRQQRGRDEVRTYVRRPRGERESIYDLEGLILRTPGGGEVPLSIATEIYHDRAFTRIDRIDQQRVVRVTADVAEGTYAAATMADIHREVLPGLLADFPGLRFNIGSAQEASDQTMDALERGMTFALLVIFGLLAVILKSYAQPLIVMSAIPFGVVGAVLGHLLMGYDLTILSILGIVALSGVVVNDSLLLVHTANRYRRDGLSCREAITRAGRRRFRPILLTSLTTFLGLTPMILETSVQARPLIPMALSLGFGVLFATVIILVLVPAIYLIAEDANDGRVRLWNSVYGRSPSSVDASTAGK